MCFEGGGGGGGAQQSQCKSESAQFSERQQSPAEGESGGLKFEKIKAGKQLSPHLRKYWTKVLISCILDFFIQPQPINIGPARRMAGWGVLSFFFIRRLGPSIYHSPQKNIRNFKHPAKVFEILTTPQKYPPFCTLTLRKDHKMHRNYP